MATNTSPATDHNTPETAGPVRGLAKLVDTSETYLRYLLDRNGLPEPDEVIHASGSVQLLWHDQKLAIVLDVGDDPQGAWS